MSSDDEYAAYNFSEFTEDDLKRVDEDVARLAQAGGPQISIQVDADLAGPPTTTSQTPQLNSRVLEKRKEVVLASPQARHRRHGTLSVTDLAALTWCEVQYDYGLRQRRSMPIASRPESFISGQGKKISVAKEVAVKNDVRTKQGRALHKALEREIRAEEVKVDISSEEEQWALRLVNMLASLRCIVLEGYTDEVVLKPEDPQKRVTSPAKSSSKRPRRSASPSQHLVTDYLATSSTPVASHIASPLSERASTPAPPEQSNTSPPRNFLHLIDTKTRKKNSLPPHKDTLPSRIQLMLYYRLLKELTSTSPPFDFAAMWHRISVDPSRSFSTTFLVQAGLVEQNDSWKMSCLNDLSKAYTEMVQTLNVAGIDPCLKLVYRLRTSEMSKKGKGRGELNKKRSRSSSPIVSQEDLDVARAIEASLHSFQASNDSGAQSNSKSNDVASTSSNIDHPPFLKESGHDNHVQTIRPPSPQSTSDQEVDKHDLTPIGIKEFEYEEKTLDRHITHALQWWRGERDPQGVSLEDSGRCRSCEYENNCEWREAKAFELNERLQRLR